jgi:hypothetical protein
MDDQRKSIHKNLSPLTKEGVEYVEIIEFITDVKEQTMEKAEAQHTADT